MTNTFLIIDDDINMRKMLEVLIRKNNLGKIVAQLDSGEYAVEEILFYNPDIVLIDLLLPIKDGIEIINMVRKEGYEGKFIMISQVEDEEMVSKAYESGIIFFITKPLNMIEAVNVIKGVCRNIELEKSFALIKNAVFNVDSQSKDSKSSKLSLDEQITAIFADIGIVGGTGGDALRKVIHKIINFKKHNSSSIYQLQEIYDEIAKEENQNGYKKVNRRAIEQRVRRTIQKSLQTIAEIGCDDYYNGKFTEYSTLLFDFSQVKQEMRFVDGDTNERGKINIKKFIEGIISKLDI
ncbi:two-component system, response regulator YcbB [Caminicella sporogenes DSM 14501]|uniref:Stage 0 sporulation protein A homolog n=1 Tax=Caminicella sporogenes DSM 14501 TaxID=1121266 RepID=A0A1M6P2R4_9FIRM|nr:response regulator [Caminicella sporogenes]RKD21550.1 response regulator receiver protein [Caminicella sporogenes]SHK02249.1 two-component system, response regulator YcbB [Caminicella sporogenes DSM 14501]